MIRIKRAYEAAGPADGYRVLVDRLWPRGLSKQEAQVDAWLRDVAPSNELRRWFGHRPERWDEFQRRYRDELTAAEAQDALRELAKRARDGDVTLLYAAKDQEHNNAVVLADVVGELAARTGGER